MMSRLHPSAPRSVLGYFVRHRTIANLLLIVMVLAGLAALPNMRAQFFPDQIVENVSVSVAWRGAGAEDVDAAIVQILEPRLLVVEGVTSSDAVSREGSARITLEFEPNWDMSRAATDVQSAVDLVTDLPQGAEAPEIRRGVWRDRVTDIVIAGPVAPAQLSRFADELTAQLFEAGVTRTTIRGVVAPQILIEAPSIKLIEHDVTLQQIAEAIEAEVDSTPAGDVSGANARIRTGAERRNVDDIGDIALKTQSDGYVLRVADIAQVILLGPERERSYFVGEDRAVSLRVDRSDQGDAIAIQERVEEVVARFQTALPPQMRAELIRTRAQAISDRLNLLVENALLGLGLVVTLLFLFLNVRTAFWVACGIPVALLAAIAIMYLAGLTFNMISLFGLIITLGIVVDDAIVVGEHADDRYRRGGEDGLSAAENAANRMALPVFAATLTTIIAFFGLVGIGGRFGELIRDIPFAVIAMLTASLIECFLILPNHMAHSLKDRAGGFSKWRLCGAVLSLLLVCAGLGLVVGFAVDAVSSLDVPLIVSASLGLGAAATLFLLTPRTKRAAWVRWMGETGLDATSELVNWAFDWIRTHAFKPLMYWVIRLRYVVIAGGIVLLASQIAVFIRGDVQWRFFNAPERGSITGNFSMVEGATRADSMDMMREMQRATETLGAEYEQRFGRNPVDFVIAEIGGNAGRGLAGADTKDPDLLGGISIELIDADLRPYSSFVFLGELQKRIERHPLVDTVSFRGWRSGPGGDALDVQFFGASAASLKAASEALKRALGQYPEVSALEDSLPYDKEELGLRLTARGKALGFTIDQLSRTLRARIDGIEAANFPDGIRSVEIRVELPKSEITSDFLDRIQLRSPEGVYTPLADIVSVERRVGFSTVRRENGIRVVSVTGDISEDDPARAAEISRTLASNILPQIAADYQVEYRQSGLNEDERGFLSDALTALGLCLAGIYLVLSWIFASWTRPMVIMAIIPFGLIGTIYGHAAWGVPLSMFTVVGLLGMTGIIINDSIVLITTIDEHAKKRGLVPSIIDGTADRLRPVLLTTLTTVLGMAPLLFEQSQQAQFLRPTVITLVYGLGVGMLLVLLIVPSLIAIQHDVSRTLRALRNLLGAKAAPLRTIAIAGGVAICAIWGATFGVAIWTGSLPGWLVDLSPTFNAAPTAVITALTFIISASIAAVSIVFITAMMLRREKQGLSD